MARKIRKVLAFGVFDGLHKGHHFFLSEARKLGDLLVISVAHDKAVWKLKNHAPRRDAAARVSAILSARLADEVFVGDEIQGSWSVIKNQRPDIIAIGHDQNALRVALKLVQDDFNFELIDIKFFTGKYKKD